MPRGMAKLKRWMVKALSFYSSSQGVKIPFRRCPDRVLIHVSRLVLSGVQIPPRSITLTPHCLSLDIALDLIAMADSDSILYCQRCPGSLSCSCSVQVIYKGLGRM